MPEIIELTEKILPESCFVFKHSTRCPISTAAAEVVKSATLNMPLYWINVVEQRDLSNWIAEEYSIQHESPQFLMLVDGKVTEILNHGSIQREALEDFNSPS